MSKHTATETAPSRDRPRTSGALVALAVSVGLVASGALVWRGTEAVFTATTTNGANSWATGSVTLTDDDSGTALFTLTNLTPGAAVDRCINVTYGGSVNPGVVKLYASGYSTTGTLGANINLTVTEGTGSTATDCTGFTPVGVATYSGTLAAFGAKTDYAAGVGTWDPAGASVTPRSYKITYQVGASAGQSETAGLTFVWEAQG